MAKKMCRRHAMTWFGLSIMDGRYAIITRRLLREKNTGNSYISDKSPLQARLDFAEVLKQTEKNVLFETTVDGIVRRVRSSGIGGVNLLPIDQWQL